MNGVSLESRANENEAGHLVAPALADMPVPVAQVSLMLRELGVDLSTMLAPAYVQAGADMLLAIDLAQALPVGADHLAACRLLSSFQAVPIEPVGLVMLAVAQEAMTPAEPGSAFRVRMNALLDHLQL